MRGGAGGRQAATTEFPLYFFLFAHAGVPLVFKYFEVCFFHLVPQTVRLQLLPGISALSCARSVEDLNGACTVLRRKFRSATHLIPFELLYVITRNYRKIRIVPHKTKNYALYTRGKPCFFFTRLLYVLPWDRPGVLICCGVRSGYNAKNAQKRKHRSSIRRSKINKPVGPDVRRYCRSRVEQSCGLPKTKQLGL